MEPEPPEIAALRETTYYRLDEGGAVVRLLDGWRPQVWMAQFEKWRDLDVNLGIEARSITREQAIEVVGDSEALALSD